MLVWPLAGLVSSQVNGADRPAKPNIVFILADDLGWRDLACYGSAIHETPNLDRLASQGTRFTQAYAAAPICSASRAAIMTGRSPARLNFEFVTKETPGRQSLGEPLQSPPFTLDLPLEEITMGEVLRTAGYATGYFGKWHLNRHHGRYLNWSPSHGPLQQGFAEGEQEFGSHAYGDANRAPDAPAEFANGDYGRDELTERAIAFVKTPRDRPFFLCLSHYYVHTPIRTRAKWLTEKYAAKLPAGSASARATFGAMVETLDHLVGRLLRALDEAGLTQRTLVVFTSDNGGHPEYSANGPLRGSKWNVYEGGVRVPFIVRWPGVVRAGSISDRPIIGTDLFPTFCAAGEASLPRDVPIDGQNLLASWRGEDESADRLRPLVWHFPYYHPEVQFAEKPRQIGVNDFAISQTRPQSALRKGDYKLIHFHESGRDELYRLSDDLSEQHDLSSREPEKARELRRDLDAYLRASGARLPSVAAKGKS